MSQKMKKRKSLTVVSVNDYMDNQKPSHLASTFTWENNLTTPGTVEDAMSYNVAAVLLSM